MKADKVIVDVSCNCENFRAKKETPENMCVNDESLRCTARSDSRFCSADPRDCKFAEHFNKDRAIEAIMQIKRIYDTAAGSYGRCELGEHLHSIEVELWEKDNKIKALEQKISKIRGVL